MAEDFLEGLAADWGRQEVEVEAIRRALRRWRWLPHAMLALEGTSAVLALVAGVGFAAYGLAHHDLLLDLSALAVFTVMPAFLLVIFRVRLPSLRWEDESPEGVLRYALVRADSARRAVIFGRWSALALVALVAASWASVLLGLSRVTPFLVAVSGFWLGAALVSWLWFRWRLARIAEEAGRAARLLAEFEQAPQA